MVFPTFGSWISNSQLFAGSSAVTFNADYVTGSSNIEYTLLDNSFGVIVDYTQAGSGLNTINTTSYSGSNIKVGFRMIGYPSLGFNPKVTSFNVTNLGGVVQTLNIGSDVQLPTTQFTTANVNVAGSFSYLMTGSVSSTNGSTWTPIPVFGQDFTVNSAGSEPIIRLVDVTGSVTLTNITAYFHGADIN